MKEMKQKECKDREVSFETEQEVTKRKVEDGMREKEQSSQGRDSFWKEVVNTIPPDTAIHEQMTMTNGYVKVCTTTSTPSTSVRP